MNLGDNPKREHDIDAMLAGWPAPLPGGVGQDEEKRWDDRANAGMRAVIARPAAPDEGLDALLAAPVLAPEPGESAATFRSGDKKMTQEKAVAPVPAAPASKAGPPTERKRGSLKEIAARATARQSQPGTPLPGSTP